MLCKKSVLKARIHCEIYLSDYFMKHNLTHISLHLIWFHEICIKYVKRKPPQTITRKKAISPCCEHWLTCFSGKEQNIAFSQAKTHLRTFFFYRTVPSGCFQMLVIFLERAKQKNFFIPTEAVVRRCSVSKGVLKNST